MNGKLLTRVKLRNYKSIAACDVPLAQLSFLVGPNGSGKSNFLDALRFVADATRFSLDHAFRDRGGVDEVRRRSGGHPNHFGVRLDFSLADSVGFYAFKIGAKKGGRYEVQQEECTLLRDGRHHHFKIESGEVLSTTLEPHPAAPSDRLFLVSSSGSEPFRGVYEAFSGMGFYNLNPGKIRELQPPDLGELLNRDGSNITSVLSNLEANAPDLKARVEEYLSAVVPGITGVGAKTLGPKETLEFRQQVRGANHPWRFFAGSMSDGTLRALGLLVALFHGAGNGTDHRQLIGIEEPEVALHPAAAAILTDGLRDASDHAQILVTSHSPDLLDNNAIPDDSILAVVSVHGETRLGRLDEASRSVLRDELYTAGELLRMGQLHPDPKASEIDPRQLDLFSRTSTRQ